MLDQILFPAYLNAQDKPQQERNWGAAVVYNPASYRPVKSTVSKDLSAPATEVL